MILTDPSSDVFAICPIGQHRRYQDCLQPALLSRFLEDPPYIIPEADAISHGIEAAALALKAQEPLQAILIIDLA